MLDRDIRIHGIDKGKRSVQTLSDTAKNLHTLTACKLMRDAGLLFSYVNAWCNACLDHKLQEKQKINRNVINENTHTASTTSHQPHAHLIWRAQMRSFDVIVWICIVCMCVCVRSAFFSHSSSTALLPI